MTHNPYDAPQAALETTQAPAAALWNPNAAANWSLLLTVFFGMWLHMKNWEALGETARAKTAREWFRLSLVLMVILLVVDIVLASQGGRMAVEVSGLGHFILLVTWYFKHAKKQVAYVKERFGTTYARRPWLRTLALWLAIVVMQRLLTGGLAGAVAFAYRAPH